MSQEKNEIWVRFSIKDSETEMYSYLKSIPFKHRAWVAKKIFLNKLNNLKDATIAIAPTVSEKENKQPLNSATSRKIPTDF